MLPAQILPPPDNSAVAAQLQAGLAAALTVMAAAPLMVPPQPAPFTLTKVYVLETEGLTAMA